MRMKTLIQSGGFQIMLPVIICFLSANPRQPAAKRQPVSNSPEKIKLLDTIISILISVCVYLNLVCMLNTHKNSIQHTSIYFFLIDYQNPYCSSETSGLHTWIIWRASVVNVTALYALSWKSPQNPLFPLSSTSAARISSFGWH